MILSEKIAEERKKNGWSQEELAEKLSVSRQAVSKWESASSVPDLQKLLRMAEIFEVSTDYLLKDEMGKEEVEKISDYRTEDTVYRNVSMEEANHFLEWKRKNAVILAGAVALCIMSPSLLIFLTGLSSATGGNLSENTAVGIGVSVVLVMVSLAVAIFISYGIRGKAYDYLKKELIETAYGVKGLVKEKKQNYEGTYTRGIILGVVFCILAVIPLLIGIAMEQPEYMITSDVSILLLLVAVGVFLIVRVSTINGSYDMLLQEGEYSQKEKAVKKKFEIYSTAYWCIATAIYLGWSFLSVRWDYTWILWPVAGVLFGAVSVVARGIWGTQDSTRI